MLNFKQARCAITEFGRNYHSKPGFILVQFYTKEYNGSFEKEINGWRNLRMSK